MADDPTSDQDLIRRARNGDREAMDVLIRRAQPHLARLVRQRMGEELRRMHESADLVQSALAEAVRSMPKFEDRGPGSFLAWLSALATHKVSHRLRDLRRERRNPARAMSLGDVEGDWLPDLNAATPSAIARGGEMEERYRAALTRLGETDRELLLLHLELGCTQQEIAEAMGLPSADAVRKRIARTLGRLTEHLQS